MDLQTQSLKLYPTIKKKKGEWPTFDEPDLIFHGECWESGDGFGEWDVTSDGVAAWIYKNRVWTTILLFSIKKKTPKDGGLPLMSLIWSFMVSAENPGMVLVKEM